MTCRVCTYRGTEPLGLTRDPNSNIRHRSFHTNTKASIVQVWFFRFQKSFKKSPPRSTESKHHLRSTYPPTTLSNLQITTIPTPATVSHKNSNPPLYFSPSPEIAPRTDTKMGCGPSKATSSTDPVKGPGFRPWKDSFQPSEKTRQWQAHVAEDHADHWKPPPGTAMKGSAGTEIPHCDICARGEDCAKKEVDDRTNKAKGKGYLLRMVDQTPGTVV